VKAVRISAYLRTTAYMQSLLYTVTVTVRLSVCLSVTRVDQSNCWFRIIHFSPYSSPVVHRWFDLL